jgi:rubrerythrin
MPTINIKDSPEFKTVRLIDLSEDSINRIAEAVVSKLDKSVRHGQWVEHHEPYTWMGYTYWSCPKCGFECGCDKDISYRTNYCPNCGAKMN